jgi:tetratricopeptide (TPR) repeat protein
MEEKITFTSNVKFGKRKLQVQTEKEAVSRKAIAAVFEAGRQIDSREYRFEKSAGGEQVEQEVRQFHDMVVADLELLYSTIGNVQAASNPDSYARLGGLLLDKGFVEEAVETFKTLLSMNSAYENGHYWLGKALYKKGELDEALKNLNKAITYTPDYPDLLLCTGRVYRVKKEFTAAIQNVRAALELNPDYHEALFTLGLCLIESAQLDPKNVELSAPIERIKEARGCLLRAAGLSSDYERKTIDLVIELLEDLDQWEQAVRELQKIENVKLSDSRSIVTDSEFYLRFMFADLHKEHKSLDNYIRLLERSVQQHPDYPDVRTSLGTAFLIRCWHYFGKALEEYREAVKINPDFQKAKKSLKLLENDGRGFLLLLRAILK